MNRGKIISTESEESTNYIGNWILWVKHCWYDKVKAKLNQTVCIFHLQCCVSSAKEKYMEICQLVISQWCNGTPIFTPFDSISKNKDRVYGKWKYKVHKSIEQILSLYIYIYIWIVIIRIYQHDNKKLFSVLSNLHTNKCIIDLPKMHRHGGASG